ncbi:hypothetical protein ES705_42745 [subsurface metagenome]
MDHHIEQDGIATMYLQMEFRRMETRECHRDQAKIHDQLVSIIRLYYNEYLPLQFLAYHTRICHLLYENRQHSLLLSMHRKSRRNFQ